MPQLTALNDLHEIEHFYESGEAFRHFDPCREYRVMTGDVTRASIKCCPRPRNLLRGLKTIRETPFRLAYDPDGNVFVQYADEKLDYLDWVDAKILEWADAMREPVRRNGVKIGRTKASRKKSAERARVTLTEAIEDSPALKAVVMPERTPPVIERRLHATHLDPELIETLLAQIHTPGNQYFKQANRWLDTYEDLVEQNGPYTPDIITVKHSDFYAVFDRLVVRGDFTDDRSLADRAHRNRRRTGPDRLNRVDWITSLGYAVADNSNGEFRVPILFSPRNRHMRELDDNQYICVEVVAKNPNDQHLFDCVLGSVHWPHYLRTLDSLPKIYFGSAVECLMLSSNAIYGTPQEAWIDLLMKRVRGAVSDTLESALTNPRLLLSIMTGNVPPGWPLKGTVRDLLLAVETNADLTEVYRHRQQWASATESMIDGIDTPGTFRFTHHENVGALVDMIAQGIALKLTGVNLLERSLQATFNDTENDQLDEPLIDLIQRIAILPSQRAEALLLATAKVYGYKRWNNGAQKGWTKKSENHSVMIADDGRIHIDGQYVCIVFKRGYQHTTEGLPYGDEIATKMWVLAAKNASRTIPTITPAYEAILNELFAKREITDKTIAALADEILEERGLPV